MTLKASGFKLVLLPSLDTMAYSFPSDPTDGQLYPENPLTENITQYKWDATAGVWNIVPQYVRLNDQEAFNSYLWPDGDGGEGEQLTTDGSGNLTWEPKSLPAFVPLQLDAPFDGVRFEFSLEDENGDPFAPVPESNILVFLGGIPQIPGIAFEIEGDTITFTEAPPIGVNFYALTSANV